MITELLKYLTVFGLSTTRYMYGFVFGALTYNLDWRHTFFTALAGGFFGTFFYYYLGKNLFSFFSRRRLKKIAQGKVKGTKIFTKGNRRIIRIKQKFGVVGIALLTPPVLSIMIGSMIAWKFYRHEKKTIPVLLISVLLYGILFNLFFYLLRDQAERWFGAS